jgi:hypothetical protein
LLLIVVNLLLRRWPDHGLLPKGLWLPGRRSYHWVVALHHVNMRGRRAAQERTLLTINVHVHGLVGSRVVLTWWGSHELLLAWLSELGLLLHEGELLRNELISWLSWMRISGVGNSRIGAGRSKTWYLLLMNHVRAKTCRITISKLHIWLLLVRYVFSLHYRLLNLWCNCRRGATATSRILQVKYEFLEELSQLDFLLSFYLMNDSHKLLLN